MYVEGDLFISGDITYQGAWSVQNAPLFQVVVHGNIYISPNVGQLDGTYIAQVNSASTNRSGEVYTCTKPAPAEAFAPLALGGNMMGLCDDKKLTVNGSVVADRILLLRTLASLRQSNSGETRASNNAAEVFNYNPANWIAQPGVPTGTADDRYDSITSLPPVL